MNWRAQLDQLTSLGAAHKGATRLADLAQARKEHLGQFFTPLGIVRCMWSIFEQATAQRAGGKLYLLDNSVGSARMFHFADPQRHVLYGMDVHDDSMRVLQEQAEQAGFECEFVSCAMEDAAPANFDAAFINPPFSLNLQSPNMQPLPCTRWGRFGPNTGAISDEFALAQALQAAKLVLAVLPSSTAADLLRRPAELLGEEAGRLAAAFDLGANAFKEEGANVNTCIVVFDAVQRHVPPLRGVIQDPASWQPPDLCLQAAETRGRPRLGRAGADTSMPSITMPVTGKKVVRVVHSGRKIHLKFECGLMQARCLNAVYRHRVYSTEHHRLPAGVRFAGQGVLDVENIVMAEKPQEVWQRLMKTLSDQGAQVDIDKGLQNYLNRRIRQRARATTPFGHWIWREQHANFVKATARAGVPVNPTSWVSPMIKAGETTELRAHESGWELRIGDQVRFFSDDEARKAFDMEATGAGWVEVHKPLQSVFPQIAQSLRAVATQTGIDKFLTWDYQLEDAIELCIRPTGAVCAWKQGLGKARLAAALPMLLRVRHCLVAMPAFLIDEFPDRLRDAGIDPSKWQVIRGLEQTKSLRTINVISYERLRMVAAGSRKTYAELLRRRVPVVICDEGEVLANPYSEQSRSIARLGAKKLFVLAGTPIPNYPRDLLNVATAAVGDGVPGQPYGIYQPMLAASNVMSMEFASRGRTSFADDFVVLEWCVNEFAETLSEGAKREVPKIANLAAYRGWVAPFIKRRLPDEPQVARHVTIPVPDHKIEDVEWDRNHLAHYLRVADEFASWWNKRHEDRRGGNLVALLARIDAVVTAGNFPQHVSESGSPSQYFGQLTSKQRWIVNRCVELASTQKVVVFARQPAMLNLLQRETAACGVECIVYHGKRSAQQRRADLKRFRHGSAQVAFASYGVTRAGLDLYQANTAILGTRSWSDREEDQAIRRLLRPQQTRPVTVEKPHLVGGIDFYQDQLCQWKASAASAGLDWGTPMPDDVEFVHLDTILGRFVEDLAKLHGIAGYKYRDILKETA